MTDSTHLKNPRFRGSSLGSVHLLHTHLMVSLPVSSSVAICALYKLLITVSEHTALSKKDPYGGREGGREGGGSRGREGGEREGGREGGRREEGGREQRKGGREQRKGGREGGKGGMVGEGIHTASSMVHITSTNTYKFGEYIGNYTQPPPPPPLQLAHEHQPNSLVCPS